MDKRQTVEEFDALEKSVVTRFVLKNILVLIVGVFPAMLAYISYILLQSSLNTEQALGTSSLAIDYFVQSVTCSFLPPLIISFLGCKWTIVIGVIGLVPYYAANLYPRFYTLLPTSLLMGMMYPVLWTSLGTYVSSAAYVYSHVMRKPPESYLGLFFGLLFMPLKGVITLGGLIGFLLLKEDALLPCPVQCGINFCFDLSYSPNISKDFFSPEQTILLCPLNISSFTDLQSQLLIQNNEILPKIFTKTPTDNLTEKLRIESRISKQLAESAFKLNKTVQPIVEVQNVSKTIMFYSIDINSDDSIHSSDYCKSYFNSIISGNNESCELTTIFNYSDTATGQSLSLNLMGGVTNFSSVNLGNLSSFDNSTFSNLSQDKAAVIPKITQLNSHFNEDSEFLLNNIFVGSTLLGLIFLAVLLDNVHSASEGYYKMVTSTCRLMKNRDQQLLILPGVMLGLLQAFAAADFSQAFVTCFKGIHFTSMSIMSFGAAVILGSSCFGVLSKYVPRFALLLVGVSLQVTYLVLLLFWAPSSDNLLIFLLLLPALHGLGESAYQTQLSAIEGVLFPGDQEAAFANCHLWEGVGLAIGFAWSSTLCVKLKIYILLGLSVISFMSYSIVEIRIWKEKKNRGDFPFQIRFL